ncbi:leucine-rich repeat extensin-like protein 5 [Lathyrus oleraceus]|uniref:leucine-rich repeat extensin-like protein 5 n=1 Tax=Pisum sativum TaxID=3888 RepID=UPI0021CE1EDF|nr:leucine-rich repeat extensin-like protein 5 [Pisum sativum]
MRKQGVDISDFNISQLPAKPPNFMKRPRGPFEKAKQAKKARLGDSSGSIPPAPLPGPSEMLNETTSPSSSSSPESPLYYNISTDTKHFDPSSPTLAQLQTRTLASQQPSQPTPELEITSSPTEQPNPTTSDPQPSETTHAKTQPNNSDTHPPNTSAEPQTPTLNLIPPSSPPLTSEPENTMPTLEEAIMLFAGALVDKGLFEQVRNDFIREAELRLQERLAREAEERARKEEEEKARQEEMQMIKEAEAKALADAAAEGEAKAAAEAEARIAEESANRKFAEENLETSSHGSSDKNF